MGNDSWMYQGRQYHMWFGHGTRPDGDGDNPGGLDERIKAIAATAIASLPASKRLHRAATFSGQALEDLTKVMRSWVAERSLSQEKFAQRFLGWDGGSAVAIHLRAAANLVGTATTQAELRDASAELAAGMQAVGLDQWRRELGRFAERASEAPGSVADVGQRYSPRLVVAAAPFQTAAIDFDPRTVPLTPDAQAIGERIYGVALAIEKGMQGYFDDRTVQSASNTLHALFAHHIEAMNIPGVTVEESFGLKGEAARYGAKGSARVDVIFKNPKTGRIEAIWDWKVGGARLNAARARELSERVSKVADSPNLPAYRIPVIELHVDLVPEPDPTP